MLISNLPSRLFSTVVTVQCDLMATRRVATYRKGSSINAVGGPRDFIPRCRVEEMHLELLEGALFPLGVSKGSANADIKTYQVPTT